MTRHSPILLQTGSYNAADIRQVFDALWQLPGVIADGDFAPSAPGGLLVQMAAGKAVIAGTDTSGQGKYLIWGDATDTATIPAAPGAGLNRLDAVSAVLRDSTANGGSNNDWVFVTTEGTPTSGTPTLPTLPQSSIPICSVLMSGTVAAVSTGMITDLRVKALGQAEMVGEIKMWSGPTIPLSWHICDHSAVSRVANPVLFARDGTTHGAGDGATTFNLPDMLGRFPIGAGPAGAGLTAKALAAKAGEETVVLSPAQMPTHTHVVDDPKHNHLDLGHQHTGNTQAESATHTHAFPATNIVTTAASTVGLQPGGLAATGITGLVTGTESAAHGHPFDTNAVQSGLQAAATSIGLENTGGGAAHDNQPPYLGLYFIIRLG